MKRLMFSTPVTFAAAEDDKPVPAALLAQRVFLRAAWKAYEQPEHRFISGEPCMEKDRLSPLKPSVRGTTAMIFVGYANEASVDAASFAVTVGHLVERGVLQPRFDCLIAMTDDSGSVLCVPRDSRTLRPLTTEERDELARFDALDASGTAAPAPTPSMEELAHAAR